MTSYHSHFLLFLKQKSGLTVAGSSCTIYIYVDNTAGRCQPKAAGVCSTIATGLCRVGASTRTFLFPLAVSPHAAGYATIATGLCLYFFSSVIST